MRAYAIFAVTISGLVHADAVDAFKREIPRNLDQRRCNKWEGVGEDITKGVGETVSLSTNGRVVAVGAKVDGEGIDSLRIFAYKNCVWQRLGKKIKSKGGVLVSAVSLSGDGKTVAVGVGPDYNNKGSVTVYNLIKTRKGQKWVNCGEILGAKTYDFLGAKNAVSLSDDGKTLAYGGSANVDIAVVPIETEGKKCSINLDSRVFLKDDQSAGARSVALSGDGLTVAVGSPTGSGKDMQTENGFVEVFSKENDEWESCGSRNGLKKGDNFGEAVSISSDGTILAVGASQAKKGKGSVTILKIDNLFCPNEEVEELGVIIGEQVSDNSGGSVSISDDGNSLAIGAMLNDGNGNQSGHTRVFQYKKNGWSQTGHDIDGKETCYRFGSSVSMSGNGKSVAIGAPGVNCDGKKERKGYVRVTKLDKCSEPMIMKEDFVRCNPKPTKRPTKRPKTNRPTTNRPTKAPKV